MVEPPSELVTKIAEKLSEADPYALDWPLPQGACNCLECCERVTRAVLADLFEACEVREEFRPRVDGDASGLDTAALIEAYVSGRVYRRLVIETPPEPWEVVPDDSEKGAGDAGH